MADNFSDSLVSSLGQTVRVSIPVSLTHNLDAMHRVTANVLKELGCAACHSGFDIRYDVLRDFVSDEKGNLRGGAGGPSAR